MERIFGTCRISSHKLARLLALSATGNQILGPLLPTFFLLYRGGVNERVGGAKPLVAIEIPVYSVNDLTIVE